MKFQILSFLLDILVLFQYQQLRSMNWQLKKSFVFASEEHEILGSFVSSYFERINGQIKLKKIREDYIPRFGQRYTDDFKAKIDKYELEYLKKSGRSIKNSYHNIIEWRNQFAHEGLIPPTATYQEAIESYFAGKEVIHCLSETMHH